MTITDRFQVVNRFTADTRPLVMADDVLALSRLNCDVVCNTCGSVVLSPNVHNSWHDSLTPASPTND